MKSYDLITPEGTRDLLFDECVARKEAEDKLRAVFTAHGYSEVITPALEFTMYSITRQGASGRKICTS